ncbi:conserved hypothetical protein [Histoplasma capsulatum var. duboisii H88]|uniref:Uncharacterized protein n=1 Tax=Ajellomyces capsulatus (strain H88) TaxID=544711 RepID=F0U9N4_AJEC8|nr:conserved hypothetical protein [Histoplasma capsulatum var. duboisii H88]
MMAKRVKHIARYYHHKTVYIDNKNDDVLTIRKSLNIPILKDEKSGFKATLLTELACCIEEYMSLHNKTGLIQCDVSL